MKKIISLLLVLMMLLGLCACGGGEGGKNYEGLQVGFARESILPDQLGVQIAGGDAAARLSDGYIDEVAATCIAIREGGETILLYTIDFITVDQHVYAAQADIAAATGIAPENIILNTTHTHNGVSIRSNWQGVDEYRTMYRAAAVTAAQNAIADLSPATMYYGSTMTENMVFVRHYLMNDGTTYGNGHGSTESGYKEHLYPSDGELQVIKFARAAEDKKDVVLMNLGAHATINSASNNAPNSISADWPYNARSYVEYAVDEDGQPDTTQPTDYLCAVFEAAAGDQIPNSNMTDIDPYGNKYPEYGNKIGEYCMGVLEGEMTKAEGSGIQLKVHKYTAATMKEGIEDVQRLVQAKELVALSSQKGGYSHPDVSAKVAEYGFNNYLEASGLVSRANYPESYSMELHLMSIDGVSFIFAPYEMFGVTGREIKDNSPYDMTFVVTCSENSMGYHMGYLPHEYACEEKFYEYSVTKFARGTAEDLAKTYVALLTELKGAE
ncbi:MAG: hypothetical protein IKU07_06735 [Oscillospiraceae bacterium]|nr:hypothetical protein [Oscillospiraceae bacterium]